MSSSSSALRSAAAASGCRLETATDEAAWLGLAQEWDRLWERMPRPSPFLLFEWLDTWRTHFARRSRLAVLTARGASGELIGAAPLHIVPRHAFGAWPLRSLEFLGYRGSGVCGDHYDFLAAEADRQPVAGMFAAELLRRGADWDTAVLADLAEDSPLPAVWGRLAPALPAAEVPAETCYYMPLAGDTAAYWAEFKRRHPVFARSVHRYRKRLREQRTARLVAPVPADEVGATFEALARFNRLARGRKGETGNFSDPAYRAFHSDLLRRMARSPRLYLARLDVDGQPAAVFYGFVGGDVLHFYQQGYDPALAAFGVGKLLLAEVVDDAIARLGLRELDFLRGGESYKTHWTSLARHTRTLRVWRGGVPARLQRAEWRLRRQLGAWRRRLWRPRTGPAA